MPQADDDRHQYWGELRALGLGAGLLDLGVAPATPMVRARAAIEDRRNKGFDADMQFTFRNPVRSTTPTLSVAGARSIVVGLLSYASVDDADPPARHARVARYARDDHNARLKSCLVPVRDRLRADGHKAVIFADDNSVVDREAAWLAGLGWFGKNANLLAAGAGSFVVIGCVVTTAELPPATPVADGCGSCARCIPACPTGAIVAPAVIDARRCLTWVLQRPGQIPRELRSAVGDRIYGCDDCQTSCPPTIRMRRRADGTSLDPMPSRSRSSIDAAWFLRASDDEIMSACDSWYIHGRDPRWLRRNALVILGNIGRPDDPDVAEVLGTALASTDGTLRAHAVWACGRLGLVDVLGAGLDAEGEQHAEVLVELANLPACRDDLSRTDPGRDHL